MTSKLTYAAAVKELQEILRVIDDAPDDLERVIVMVRRADELMKYCRTQLEDAEQVVNDILATGYQEEE